MRHLLHPPRAYELPSWLTPACPYLRVHTRSGPAIIAPSFLKGSGCCACVKYTALLDFSRNLLLLLPHRLAANGRFWRTCPADRCDICCTPPRAYELPFVAHAGLSIPTSTYPI